jgi:uncharacterized membrane protein
MARMRQGWAAKRYERNEAEYTRIVTFSDAVFAIAMTLLIVTVDAPEPPVADLTAKVRALSPEIFSFFLSFAVIGHYWLAHHRFFGLLQSVSGRLLRWNLLYLALVAFLPWPTALVGDFPSSAVAVVSYALCAAAVNGVETRMYAVALEDGSLKR